MRPSGRRWAGGRRRRGPLGQPPLPPTPTTMNISYLAASSLASFVTIHAQWANPPWLTRLTLLPPSSVHSSLRSKRSLRSPTDTITQSANDDGDDADDSLLLNLTPLNCRSSEDEIPPRTQIAVRTISVRGRRRRRLLDLRHTNTQHEERRRKSFSLFPPVCFGQTRTAQVFTLSS